jgi:hypothetical protein
MFHRDHPYLSAQADFLPVYHFLSSRCLCTDGFYTHYKNISFVYFSIKLVKSMNFMCSAIKLVKDINEWIDPRKYPTKENEVIEELQENIQAVHRSLDGLDCLFSDKNNQDQISREDKVAFFVVKELSKLEEMKKVMEEIDQKEGGKKLGSRGKRALEMMKKCYEHAEQRLSAVRDDSHTLGDLENALEDVSKKLYHLAEIVARKELENAKEHISEVKKKGWDNELTIKDILAQRDHAEYAHQCLEKFDNQLAKCIDLTTKQHDKKAVERLLTAIKDLTGHYDKVLLVKQVIEWAPGRKDLGRLDESAKGVLEKECNKARKLILEVKSNNWNKSTIENIVADKSYAEYAHQCFLKFTNQLQECIHLVEGEETTQQHDENTIKQLLTALKDVTDHYEKCITVKYGIELAQARKDFQENRSFEAAQSVKKALEKFEPPQHLIKYHREILTRCWLQNSIDKMNNELMCKSINNVIGCDKANKKSELGNLDKNIKYEKNPKHFIDDPNIVFRRGGKKYHFVDYLRYRCSKKEWFSKLEERQIFDTGQIKEVMEEYYENYLKAVDKKIQDLLQEGDPQIWTRCDPEILIKILQCGRFKSQFETGRSGGGFCGEMIANNEHGVAGIPHNMPKPFRFIYGYATSNPDGMAGKAIEQYGLVAVHLKPELKEFALQMLCDSMWESNGSTVLNTRPTFFGDEDRRCIRSCDSSRILRSQKRGNLEEMIQFQEVQIPAVYKEDIQEVVFYTRMDEKPRLKEELIQVLEQHAIPYRDVPLLRFQQEDIVTEDDYRYYEQCKKQIVAAMGQEDDVLLGSLQNIPFFEDLYGMSVGEGYTLKEHTSMVLEQFRKYQMENWNSPLLTKEEFQLMLAIHDIGKPQAVQETGKTSMQHEYNGRIIPGFLKWLGISEEKSKLIVAFSMQDHLGEFFKYANYMEFDVKRAEAKEVAENISGEAAKIGIGVEEYFDLITCYYRADAGSYTEDAGGIESLDLLFEEKTDSNCTRKFAQRTQKNYDILAEAVKSIASSKELEFKGGRTF